jgi:hypothetical protein
MKTDGIFTLHQVTVKYKLGQMFTLRPFGDVHRDNPGIANDKWAEFLSDSAKLKDPLFLGMGDYFDSFSTSERVILGNSGIHESTKKNMETEGERKVSSLHKEIDFMEGDLIGLLGGNHFIQFKGGKTSDMMLADKLNTNYLGSCSAIRITFEPKDSGMRGKKVSVDIFAHHGKGAGNTTVGRMMSVEKMVQICEADIFLQGHNHARGVLPLGDKLRIDSNSSGLFIRSRHCWIGRTGGFLRGYVNDEPSYIVDALMPPTSLGWIDFTLTPKRIRENGEDRMTVEIGSRQ